MDLGFPRDYFKDFFHFFSRARGFFPLFQEAGVESVGLSSRPEGRKIPLVPSPAGVSILPTRWTILNLPRTAVKSRFHPLFIWLLFGVIPEHLRFRVEVEEQLWGNGCLRDFVVLRLIFFFLSFTNREQVMCFFLISDITCCCMLSWYQWHYSIYWVLSCS